MGYVVEKSTGKVSWDVNEPNYDPADYLINPDLTAVTGIDEDLWKVEADAVVPRTDAEQVAVRKPARIAQVNTKTRAMALEAVIDEWLVANGDSGQAIIDDLNLAENLADLDLVVDNR